MTDSDTLLDLSAIMRTPPGEKWRVDRATGSLDRVPYHDWDNRPPWWDEHYRFFDVPGDALAFVAEVWLRRSGARS